MDGKPASEVWHDGATTRNAAPQSFENAFIDEATPHRVSSKLNDMLQGKQ